MKDKNENQITEIDLFTLWEIFSEKMSLMIKIIAVFTSLALIYAILADSEYRAETIIVPAANEDGGSSSLLEGNLGGLSGLGLDTLRIDRKTEKAVAILNSRTFNKKFIIDEKITGYLLSKEPIQGTPSEKDLWDAVRV